MPLKIINATEAKPGVNIMVDGVPCTVRTQDISKTGKHGAMKARIDAIGIVDGKKRVLLKPGHERLEVPNIDKRKGQIISISGNEANLMDVETFETIVLPIPEEVLDVKEGVQVEYWDIEGIKVIKRAMTV